MTDQPQAPGAPGNSGAWQPVPGGGDYDPDQTMHVSFAAQLPPEPRPGEDPLGAHGPVGPGGSPGPADADPATQWSIPVIRDDVDGDSGEFSVGTFSSSPSSPSSAWDQAPSPAAPTQSFPAGMFGQGAAAAQAAQAAQAAAQTQGRPLGPPPGSDPGQAPDRQHQPHDPAYDRDRIQGHVPGAPFGGHEPGAQPPAEAFGGPGDGHFTGQLTGHLTDQLAGHLTGQWTMPFTGPEGGDAVPWLPAHAPAADGAWFGVVDDPEGPDKAAPHPDDPAAAAPRTLDSAAPDAGLASEAGTSFGPGDGTAAYEPATGQGAAQDPVPGGVPGAVTGPDPAADDAGRGAGNVPDDVPDHVAEASGVPDASDLSVTGRLAPGGTGPAPEGAEAEPEDEAEPEPEPVEETRSEHPLASYMLRVNGADRPVTDAWLGESLLYVLRERLGLAGAKDGCEQGECGACSVQVDGRLVASCLVPAATAAGSDVRTVEGLTVDGRPSDVQRALSECGAVQCGFCIPGMAMTVHDLLEGNHKPTDLDVRQALSGNLCRCSGYRGVLDAVRQVVADRETDDDTGESDDQTRVPHQGGHLPGGVV